MERLNRKPTLGIEREIPLPDGTIVALRSVPARVLLSNMKEKNMSDTERGLRIMAQKIIVKLPGQTDFQEIVYEELLDCFNDKEMTIISQAIAEDEGDEKNV